VKIHGHSNDLIDRLRADPAFAGVQWAQVLDPTRYTGRAPEQVDGFIQSIVAPIRIRYKSTLSEPVSLRV
jgi:adenylosuccinate lyase